MLDFWHFGKYIDISSELLATVACLESDRVVPGGVAFLGTIALI